MPKAKIVEVISPRIARHSWMWLRQCIRSRPDLIPGDSFIYDLKQYKFGRRYVCLSHTDAKAVTELASLYLISLLCDQSVITAMVNGRVGPRVCVVEHLDPIVRSVIANEKRFRHGFSEHIAFWVNLAASARLPATQKVTSTIPNLWPEKSGHDGLATQVISTSQPTVIVELHSVKSSVRKPQALIASGKLRRTGRPIAKKPYPLLDSFGHMSKKGTGLILLGQMLDGNLQALGVDLEQRARLSLFAETGTYNAIVVSDERHATPDLFVGYQCVIVDPNRRVATYVGADDWSQLAKDARQSAINILQLAGVW
jgi:hypothetical protein